MIVNKIYDYLEKGDFKLNDYVANQVGYLASYAFKSQFMETRESSGNIYMSSAGKCTRAIAYKYLNVEENGKTMDGRAKITFFTGDMMEIVITKLAELAGCNLIATGLNQIRLTMDVPKSTPNGTEVVMLSGRPDGLLVDDRMLLVEFKSMSSYTFGRFMNGYIDPTYDAQIQLYMDALKLKGCVFVAINKDSCVLHENFYNRNDETIANIKRSVTSAVNATVDNLPDGWYKADEKGIYPWQCMYCSYCFTCHPNSEVKLIGNSNKLIDKDAYKAPVKKVPKAKKKSVNDEHNDSLPLLKGE